MWLDPITVRINMLRTGSRSSRLARSLIQNALFLPSLFAAFQCGNRLCGGYSNLEPRLPIPNRTVKRVCADDSVHSHAKVGHRQTIPRSPIPQGVGLFCLQILTLPPPKSHLVEGMWRNCNNETKSFSGKGKLSIAGGKKSRYSLSQVKNFRSPIKKGR